MLFLKFDDYDQLYPNMFNNCILKMTSSQNLLKSKDKETFVLSTEGLTTMLNRKINPQYPSKDVSWTDDFKVELPIKRSSEGVGSFYPQTLIDSFRNATKQYKNLPALSVKRDGSWVYFLFYAEIHHISSIL